MSLKKGKEAVKELLENIRTAGTADEVNGLTNDALAHITFAELDEKRVRMSRTEGNKLAEQINAAKALRLSELILGV
ncbi:hypothetical protein [Pseudomonas syringae]|uniref:hypothetical protein n=1 Tax=Pseudomonas syringae TaxID=317 RepID=UPI003F74F83E